MFEYAISDGEGTLIDYGVVNRAGTGVGSYIWFRDIIRGFKEFEVQPNGDTAAFDSRQKPWGSEKAVYFRAISPDCLTGQ